MLNEQVKKLVNEQINKEFYSAYLYLDMSNYYDKEGLDGFANWFKVQAQEERDHAMLFIDFMSLNNEEITFAPIDAPKQKYAEFIEPLKGALSHEQYVTASIGNIYDAAMKVKDFKTTQFLDWFLKEQIEEEKNSEDLITKYTLYAKDGQGLHALNAELLTRAYSAPSLVIKGSAGGANA